jgi:EmrB/QacA subfamily drug resistance transporter
MHQDSRDRSIRQRKLVTLLVVSTAVFMLPLDYTVVAVALHDIERDLHASFVDLQWVVNGYTLAFASFVLASGSLADLFGRRRVFMLGMLLFGASSLASGLAPTPLVLNLARGLLGIGAALMYAACLPLLVVEFDGAERARAFGVFGAVVGIGAALGPFLGGIVVDRFGWRWAFLVNVPVIAVLLVLARAYIAESRNPAVDRVDWIGLASFTLACFCMFYAVIGGNDAGWTSVPIIAALALALALFIVFVAAELRVAQPMMDLRLFRDPTFVGANTTPVVLAVSFWSLFLYFPLYYQGVLGYSPLQAGAAVLPFALPMFFMGPAGAWLAQRVPSNVLLAAGQLLVGLGAALMLVPEAGAGWRAYAAGALLCGCGNGLINGEMNNVALSLVPVERSGMASGINGTARQVGIALGFAGLGAILSDSIAARFLARAGASEAHRTLAARIVRGDLSGLGPLDGIAREAVHHGFQTIALWAAAVGVAGAMFTYVTVRTPAPR